MRLRRLPRAGGLPAVRNVMPPDLYVISARGRLRSGILAFLPEADSVPAAFDNRCSLMKGNHLIQPIRLPDWRVTPAIRRPE